MKTRRHCQAALLLTACLGAAFPEAAAQPSGGPYGPLLRSYDLPKPAGRIYYVAPDGQEGRSGDAPGRPATLEAAITRARTGDAIVMRGGTYRTGGLILNQGVLLQPYADERPVVKGTYIADQWDSLGNGLWTTKWSHLFPAQPADWWQRTREGKQTPLYRFNNDMVFLDGRFLQAVGWEGDVDADSYYIDYAAGIVYIGADPKEHLVEITAFDAALVRTTKEVHGMPPDRRGYTIRGITFTQYAYRALEIEGTEPEGPADEARYGKEIVGSTLEDCTITFCSRVAGYFRGDRFTMRRCRVSDTSTEGVYIIASNDVLLEQNVFTRNNIERITGYYPAAVKIFNQCHRVTCRNNLVIDLPYSNGIWYDVGNVDGIFINNWVQGVGRTDRPMPSDRLWPSDNGFFFEISKGAVCAGNVFVDCDHGVMVLNSSDVLICRNTFVNSVACIGRNGRVAAGDHFGWHASTGPDLQGRDGHQVLDNLLTADAGFTRPLMFVWQPAALCAQLTKPMLSQLDGNVYVRATSGRREPLILWSPATGPSCQSALASVSDLHAVAPGLALHDRVLVGYGGPLFTSRELGDYRLLPGSPVSGVGVALPPRAAAVPGVAEGSSRQVGAYPVAQ